MPSRSRATASSVSWGKEAWEKCGKRGPREGCRWPSNACRSAKVALELIKRVRHPHLLAVHGYWLLDEFLVIGLELAEESLRARLHRQPSGLPGLPFDEVLLYLTDAAEALDYLGRPVHRVNGHTASIQHRDVKPANLLLQGGAVKVADFGLARALQALGAEPSFSMTPAYAPPEFFAGETAATSDQYSLGVTYYQLRTGRLPFAGTPAEIMHGHLKREPDLTGLSDRERSIVARALAKDPALRWAGCVKFIGEIARGSPTATAPSSRLHISTTSAVPPGDSPDTSTSEMCTVTYHGQPVTSGLLLVDGELVPIPLRRTDVRAVLTAGCAEVTVSQVFVNTYDRALNATYVFPLPEDAAVHGLRMLVEERIIEGVVRDREEARATYEEAKREGHGAALVEEKFNLFTTSLANILPGQEVRVEIRYLQSLSFEGGQYRFVFPTVVAPRYVLGSDPLAEPLGEDVPTAATTPPLPQGLLRGDTVSLEIDLDTGVPLCGFDSPSHDVVILEEDGSTRVRIALRSSDEIPNRDFVLTYRVAGPRLEHALFYEPTRSSQPGSFLLITTPPVAPFAPSLPREVIFVIDCSGSMSDASLEQARQAVRQLLDRLDPSDAFNVIAFNTQVTPLSAMPLAAEEANLRRARLFLDPIPSRGGSEMLEPLRLALHMPPAPGPERVRLVVFLTAGSVHGERELLAALRPAIGRARVVAFGIGPAVNRHLLGKLAAAGRGFAEFLFPGENIARVVDRTLRRLRHAVLTDLELQWEGGTVEGVLPERCPDVYPEQPLVVLGRFHGPVPPTLTVQGRLAGEPYAARLEPQQVRQHEGGIPLACAWARQRIEELLDRLWERPDQEPELRRQVITLAKQYTLASPFTSFLAVEYHSQREREQACRAVTMAIPPYMPQGMARPEAALLEQILAESRPGPAKVSLQDKLGRVRPPRCQITYDVEGAGARQRLELPFVVGVLADLSGHPQSPLPPLGQRPFRDIDRDNFTQVLQEARPRLTLQLPDRLTDGGSEFEVELFFRDLNDFEPARVVAQVPALAQARAERDQRWSRQLNDILHHPDFQRLEATWRGLHYLVQQTETSHLLKIRVLNGSKKDLSEDLQGAAPFEQTGLFQKVSTEERHPHGQPFGLLLGDYEFSHEPADVGLLTGISRLAGAAHVPFVAGACPRFFHLKRYPELSAISDLSKVFLGSEYAAWNAFRDSEDSCYVALTLPRILARLPYRENGTPVAEFPFEEFLDGADHDKYLWMNAAWAFAARVTDAFARDGWFERICGLDGGGRVEGLPVPCLPADAGEAAEKGPAEIALAAGHEKELRELGFLPLFFDADRSAAFFLGVPGCQKQKPGGDPSRQVDYGLNHLLGAVRFVHYLTVMACDRMGSFMESEECERWLNGWIHDYVLATPPGASPEAMRQRPLAEAEVRIRPVRDREACHELAVRLRLHTNAGQTTWYPFLAEVPMQR
jgi:type VI secretion system ImpC/EvpB family protein